MKGKCLCGEVEFEVMGKLPNLYQCHCSLCQKATGSSASSALVTSIDNVKWNSGEDKISSYTKENGYKTNFCSVCGSPVPNIMSIGDYVWIPAGLLGDVPNRGIAAHIYFDSKSSWEREEKNVKKIPNGPENVKEFIAMLHELHN